MTVLEFLRNKAFWALDSARGGKVRHYLSNLRRIEDGLMPDEELKKYTQERLETLLKHAKATVPYYAGQESLDLSRWPVVNKDTIRSDYDRFLSTDYDRDSLITMSTSGSTGTPFVCYQDGGKKRCVNAETLYYDEKLGFKIGRRIIYLRSVVSETKKSPMQQFAQNIYLINCTDLSDQGIEAKLAEVAALSKHCGAMMMAYSSTYDALRKYFERNGYDKAAACNLYGMVGGSTMMYDETREAMEKAFRCKCISRYSNEENGFLGQDGIKNNVFIMNRADYLIEILKLDSDEPAADGEIGRIVVTDYYNMAMPMIRYDTGDVGAWEAIDTPAGKRMAIGSFGGRKVDMIYGDNGQPVSPHSISTAMWKYRNVRQYQFAQTGAGKYQMRVNIGGDTLAEDELIADIRRIVGDKAEVEIRYVDEIPVLNSGKRRYIVNETGADRRA